MHVTTMRVEANLRNAERSTGPKSPPGKLASAANSRKHGLSSPSAAEEEALPGFSARYARWDASVRPASPEAKHALRQAVAATFRIERCQAAYAAAVEEHAARARETWDDDRLADAAALLGSLSRRPEAVAPALRASAAGAGLMLRAWARLAASLEAKAGAWSDEEISTACDLLGLPAHLRAGALPFDPPDDATDRLDSRRAFVARESEALREAAEGRLARVDRVQRTHAEVGASAMQARSVRLVLRYEAAARRWFERMLAVAKSDAYEPRTYGADARNTRPPAPARPVHEAIPSPATEGIAATPPREIPARSEVPANLTATRFAPAFITSPARPADVPTNRHERRRREALARRG